jgi:hypothetical protein
MSSPEDVVRQFNDQTNDGNAVRAPDMFSLDAANFGRRVGREGIVGVLQSLLQAFPDMHGEIVDLIAVGDGGWISDGVLSRRSGLFGGRRTGTMSESRTSVRHKPGGRGHFCRQRPGRSPGTESRVAAGSKAELGTSTERRLAALTNREQRDSPTARPPPHTAEAGSSSVRCAPAIGCGEWE